MIQRSVFLLIACVCISLGLSAQSPFWLRNVSGPGNDEVIDMVSYQTDYYITGYYSNSVFMGSTVLHSIQNGDAFVAKVNREGEFVWAQSISGVFSERGLAISVMDNGTVVVSGHFSGPIQFGTTQLNSNGSLQDLFIATYNTNGEFLWAKKFGGIGIDILSDIQVDLFNNILLTGQFIGKIGFDSDTLTSGLNAATNEPTYDIFLTKLSLQGDVIWSKHGKSSKNNRSGKIAIGADNSIFLSGNFSDTLTFVNEYQNNSNNMGFLMRFQSDGNVMWFRRVQSAVTEISDIACNDNMVYLVGRYSGIQRFANDSSTSSWQYLAEIPREFTYYMAGYNYSGIYQFGRAEGSDNEITIKSIKPISTGGFAIAGEFKCFHSDYQNAYGNGLFLSRGFTDIFLSKYDLNANRIWAKQMGGPGTDEVNSLVINSFNNPVVGGSFTESFSSPARQSWGEKPWYQYFTTSDGLPPLNFCGDSEYNFYAVIKALGSKDIFMANVADESRSTMDVFNRSEGSCVLDIIPGYFELINHPELGACAPDTISAVVATGNKSINGLTYRYSHNNSVSSASIFPVISSGNQQLQAIAMNTCYSFSGSIASDVFPSIPEIQVTTSIGFIVNISSNQANCKKLLYAYTASEVILTATPPPAGMVSEWVLPNGSQVGGNTLTLQGNTFDYFTYKITNPESGCVKEYCLRVRIIVPPSGTNGGVGGLGNYDPSKLLFKMGDRIIFPGDTLIGCRNDVFELTLVDIQDNPLGDTAHIYALGSWSYSNDNLGFLSQDVVFTEDVHTFRYKLKADTLNNGEVTIGIYFFTSSFSICELKVVYPIHVVELPRPDFNYELSGDLTSICPGLIASYTLNTEVHYELDLDLSINNVVSESPLTFTTIYPQSYLITFYDTSYAGCADTIQRTFSMSYHQAPDIITIPENGIVCEGEFVEMTVPGSISTVWYGPTGEELISNLVYETDVAGYYYAIITDSNNCELISNTENIRDRSTFGYELFPEFICPNQPAEIHLFALPGDNINWVSPLNGNSLDKTVTTPGIYRFTAPYCGIIDTFLVEVPGPEVSSSIILLGDTILCAQDSLILKSEYTNQVDLFWRPGLLNADSLIVTEAGAYILQMIDENVCLTYDTVIVTQANIIDPPEITSSIEHCGNELLYINAPTQDSVGWFVGNDFLVLDTIFAYLETYLDSVIYISNFDSQTGCFSERVVYPVEQKTPFLSSIEGQSLNACKNESFIYTVASSSPVVTEYIWLQVLGDSTQFIGSDSILMIPNFQPANAGLYQLIVRGNPEIYCDADTIQFNLAIIDVPEMQIISSASFLCDGDMASLSISPNTLLSQYNWQVGNSQFNSASIEINSNMFSGDSNIVQFSAIYDNTCSVNIERPIDILETPPNPLAPLPTIACSSIETTISLPNNQNSIWYSGINQLTSVPQNYYSFIPIVNQAQLFIRNTDATGNCFSDFVPVPVIVNQHIDIPDLDDVISCPNNSISIEFFPTENNISNFYWKDLTTNSILAVNVNQLSIIPTNTTIGLFATANGFACGTDSSIFNVTIESSPDIWVNPPLNNIVCGENGSFAEVFMMEPSSMEFILNSFSFPFENCVECDYKLLFINDDSEGIQTGYNELVINITSENNCTESRLITFNLDLGLPPEIELENYQVCIGDTLHIDPAGNFNFDWTNSPSFDYYSNPIFGFPTLTTVYAMNSNSLDYIVDNDNSQLFITYINPATGCKSSFIEIPIELKPNLNLPQFEDIGLCENDSSQILLFPSITGLGEFFWTSPNSSIITDSIFTIYANGLYANGQFILIGSSSETTCGTDTAMFAYESFPLPTLALTTDSFHVCTGMPLILHASLTGETQFEWNYNGTSSQDNPLILNLPDFSSDSLLIQGSVSNSHGCVVTDDLMIAVYPTPEMPDLTVPTKICAQDTILLTLNNILLTDQQFTYSSNVLFGQNGNQLIYIPGLQDTVISISSAITTEHCASDTLTTVLRIHQLPAFNLGNDSLLFCFGVGMQLDGPPGYSTYSWSTGSTEQSIEIFETGTYALLLTDEHGCLFNDTIFVVGDWPIFDISTDTIHFCYGDPVELVGPEGFDNYAWNTGVLSANLKVTQTGLYTLTITDANGCQFSDSIYVQGGDCEVQNQPNVFTPNGDDFNDKFKLKPYGAMSYSMVIHDRWGKHIKNVSEADDGWDGRDTFGKEMPEGVYYFVAQVNYLNSSAEEIRGMIQLLK